ncbi:magnesium transporter CorA family protein [Cellulomonas sp. JH27-2]|uniref:magnesium transporter CorA family protein n=1 Tax=Cellulomonas sp. JH27-2 TaxID=2774139 RepID=UPI00177F0B36|nr:magnesium transporter CorA family protein [Cellulomonas sp. JH27-2]MBD8058680.1 magnesium transporter CorA family protein [Cellulomonas sp. JH27-2]
MQIHLVTPAGVTEHTSDELATLLAGDGIVWVDVPRWDDEAADVLTRVLGLHPMAVHDCAVRNRLPKVHSYPDVLFLVLHAPERGAAGHIHHVELDRFVGPDYLVTVHGPYNEAVTTDVAEQDTRAVLERIRAGRLRPRTPFDISHAIVSAITRRMERFVEELTNDVWELERKVTADSYDDPEKFLDTMFRTRHGLLSVRTIAAQTAEIYRRVVSLPGAVPDESRHLLVDLVDQFERIAGLAGEEKEYLQGVIEFYRTRTDTKMTIAAERLAVIAVVTLPITALASILGMNLIVNQNTVGAPLAVSLAVMLAMSGLLLWWARRQGWW